MLIASEKITRMLSSLEDEPKGPMGYFSKMVCKWAVRVGMRAARIASEKARPAIQTGPRWRVDANLGRRVVEDSTMEIALQPKVSLGKGGICGYEAFARPEINGKIVPASAFVKAVEMSGMQSKFDWRVLEAGFALAAKAKSGPNAPISFNVSPETICESGFADRLGKLVESTGANIDGLKIEILEKNTLNFYERHHMRSELAKASKGGFQFSIDDFGTEDANCGSLSLPAGELKIDAFYINALDRAEGVNWVSSMVRLGRDKGMSLCAEGVEHAWQAEALSRMGVDTGQGYYFHRPLDADTALALGPDRQDQNMAFFLDSGSVSNLVFQPKPSIAPAADIPPPLESMNFGGLLSKRRKSEAPVQWEAPSPYAAGARGA